MSNLIVNNLTKTYHKKVVLNELNFTLKTRDITALVGENGSGKTTLLKALAQIIPIDQGEIFFNNQQQYHQLQDVLLIPDQIILPKNLPIVKLMELFRKYNPNFSAIYVQEFLNFFKISQTQTLQHLSKGNQEIIQLGLFMANKPKFLLLDEPLASVDILKRNFLYEKIIDLNADGIGILLSSHILSEIQNIFSQVIILKNQQIKEIITTEEIYAQGYENLNNYLQGVLAP